MLRLAFVLACCAAPLPALAQAAPSDNRPAASLAGSWALRVDGATVFRFDLEQDGDGWKGTWVRARSFASTGDSFSRFSDERLALASSAGKAIGEWAELTFPDNRPNAVPDIFRFRLIGADRVEMIYTETGLAPFTLVRVPATTPLGPFEPGKVYRRLSVEMLGLPADAPPEPAPEATPTPKSTEGWSLPPRQTDRPAAEGGR